MGKLAMKLLQIAAVIAVGLSLSARADTVPFWPNGQCRHLFDGWLAALATPSDTITAAGFAGRSLWGFVGGGDAASLGQREPLVPACGEFSPSLLLASAGGHWRARRTAWKCWRLSDQYHVISAGIPRS
jgi:hypothetical protein